MNILHKVITSFLFVLIASLFPLKTYASDFNNSWTANTSLPYKLASHASFSDGNRVYIVGGSAATGQSHSNIISSNLDSNGLLNSWVDVGVLPTAPIWHTLVKRDKLIYILGGREENPGSVNDFVSTVYSGLIENNGTVGSWSTLSPLPEKLALGAAVIVGDRIFYSGGFNNAETSNKVYSAPINPDGTLGSWIIAGEMPQARFGHGMVEYGNYIYILGGYNGSYLNSVIKASVNSDGTISSFTNVASIPKSTYRGHFLRTGNTIFSVGGSDEISSFENVYHANISPDGSIDSWELSANILPQPVHGGSLSLVNNYLYLLGGYDSTGGGYLSSVYFTKLNTNSDVNLSVPLLKQTDLAWGNQTYDSANVWSPNSSGISSWGCALTSAAMVFRFHKIENLPDGQTLNPGTLNNWLKLQPDGYIRNGLVNWLALSRMSKQAAAENPSFLYDALEYKRSSGMNDVQLKEDVNDNIPNILEEQGHFIVGKGYNESTFLVNDPYYSRIDLLEYGNTYLSRGRYIPSNTDLSYIMVVVNESAKIVLKNNQGQEIGDVYLQQPLENDEDPLLKSGDSVKILYYPTPQTNQYTLELSSEDGRFYQAEFYLYDQNGEVKLLNASGIGFDTEQYHLDFSKSDLGQAGVLKVVNFVSVKKDLEELNKLNSFKVKGVYVSISSRFNQAERIYSLNHNSSRTILSSLKKYIDQQKSKMTSEAYKILSSDIDLLISSL